MGVPQQERVVVAPGKVVRAVHPISQVVSHILDEHGVISFGVGAGLLIMWDVACLLWVCRGCGYYNMDVACLLWE